MKKLCIFTKYSKNGPSSRYRIINFEDDLKQFFEIKIFEFWNEKYYSTYMLNKKKYFFLIGYYYLLNAVKRLIQIIFLAPKYDIVLFQKCVIPGIKWQPGRYLKKRGCRLILDVDDAVYLEKSDSTISLSYNVDALIVGNEELEKVYKKNAKNVYILPTVEFSPNYTPYKKDTFMNKQIIWIGSSSSIKNLEIVVKPLNTIITRYPCVSFKFICNAPYGYNKKILNSIFVPWDEKTALFELSSGSVGIMPLIDDEFNRGKCGFKLIQYMNMGKPVVASQVGTNAKIIGKCGFSVKNSEEWTVALEKLLFNEEIYRNCEKNINSDFFSEYGYDAVLEKLIHILNGE